MIVLFRNDALDEIRSGRISVVFRRWKTARVLAGSRLRTRIGLIEVRSIDRITRITAADAKLAGYDTAVAATADVPGGDPANPLFRIGVGYGGDDPRIALRADDDLSPAQRTDLLARLDRMDRTRAWTRPVLRLIEANPAVRAGDLYASAGYPDMLSFKRDVRRLKELGLTESLPVGYRLSPRGRSLLAGG